MSRQNNLPNTDKWQPREDAKERLSGLFLKRCQESEKRILERVKVENEIRVDNFDSGLGMEDIIREELSKLLPKRYSVRKGVLDDRYGKTAGDCDVIIFNDLWFPSTHSGATETSRRFHFPVEGAYSVIEIKPALDFKNLDDALEKLVMCHRLHRPVTQGDRIAENRRSGGCPHNIANPLYSAVMATSLPPGITFEDLVNRFFQINRTLKRHEVIRSLCVLNVGTVTWGLRNTQTNQTDHATFHDDYHKALIPIWNRSEIVGSAFYILILDILTQLNRSILSPENLALKYGAMNHAVSVPSDENICLSPSKPPQTFDPEAPN